MRTKEFTSRTIVINIIDIPSRIRHSPNCQHLIPLVEFHNYSVKCYNAALSWLSDGIEHAICKAVDTVCTRRSIRTIIRRELTAFEQWVDDGMIPVYVDNLHHNPRVKRLLDDILKCVTA